MAMWSTSSSWRTNVYHVSLWVIL